MNRGDVAYSFIEYHKKELREAYQFIERLYILLTFQFEIRLHYKTIELKSGQVTFDAEESVELERDAEFENRIQMSRSSILTTTLRYSVACLSSISRNNVCARLAEKES